MYSLSRFELTYRYPNRILVTNEVQSWLEIDSLKSIFGVTYKRAFLWQLIIYTLLSWNCSLYGRTSSIRPPLVQCPHCWTLICTHRQIGLAQLIASTRPYLFVPFSQIKPKIHKKCFCINVSKCEFNHQFSQRNRNLKTLHHKEIGENREIGKVVLKTPSSIFFDFNSLFQYV